MKIATYNVNSIRRRLPIVLAWLNEHRPDVLCLQERKLPITSSRCSCSKVPGTTFGFVG
jgi:exonuclease III